MDPENLDSLTSGTAGSIDDLFYWGHDRFVMGKITDGKNSTVKRKKTNHEIFMEAIMEGESEE